MVILIRATWSSGAYNLQGANNAVLVRQLNTLKRELSHQNDQLLIRHQDENIIDGGEASSIQFHFLVDANTEPALAATTGLKSFDCNNGAAGTAEYVFDLRRDLLKRSNIRNF
jgi:hypothetical protein